MLDKRNEYMRKCENFTRLLMTLNSFILDKMFYGSNSDGSSV